MTRPMHRRLLTLALASALSLPALAQTALAPFTVSDIRIDGLQRIGAGTVFTYLPIERGDTLDQGKAAEALRALYKTGFFEDVRLDRQGGILVISVVERPAINKLTLSGNKDLKTEDLTKGLKDIGLAEGETYNPLNLDRVTQELTRQYNNRGKYGVQITPSVERLDRNLRYASGIGPVHPGARRVLVVSSNSSIGSSGAGEDACDGCHMSTNGTRSPARTVFAGSQQGLRFAGLPDALRGVVRRTRSGD